MGSGEVEEATSSSSWRCSLVGRLLFSWFDGYVAMGRARALTADEIPELEEEFRYTRGQAQTWDGIAQCGQSACRITHVDSKLNVTFDIRNQYLLRSWNLRLGVNNTKSASR